MWSLLHTLPSKLGSYKSTRTTLQDSPNSGSNFSSAGRAGMYFGLAILVHMSHIATIHSDAARDKSAALSLINAR